MPNSEKGNGKGGWTLTKEKILFYTGLAIVFYELIGVGFLNQDFRIEGLILGATFCGVSVAQWGDKK